MKKGIWSVNLENQLHIYGLTLQEFIKSNPPCKDCLVQSMCIMTHTRYPTIMFKRSCRSLSDFVKQNLECSVYQKQIERITNE